MVDQIESKVTKNDDIGENNEKKDLVSNESMEGLSVGDTKEAIPDSAVDKEKGDETDKESGEESNKESGDGNNKESDRVADKESQQETGEKIKAPVTSAEIRPLNNVESQERQDEESVTSYEENYLEALREELVQVVQTKFSPVALKYGYSHTPLEDKIKWRPLVLLLGNYSSGKSTLINELLGKNVQTTGQAPTDDSFTVITYDSSLSSDGQDVSERDGKVLLNDDSYPFSSLKKHGKRFAAHFRLKKVNSPFLKNLALLDTPGMLDSVAEKDRGYHYQEVVGDFASIADLILILFDPHKAGTIRETYESLRRTLPKATYEDRVLFVLNRVDECNSLDDLLRVYGTLCWNLSQMTGRKDIPPIHLAYSTDVNSSQHSFLGLLVNQRQQLREKILLAPKHRLDHLATYVEEHGERLSHFLEAIVQYGVNRRHFNFKYWMVGCFLSFVAAATTYWVSMSSLGDQVSPILCGILGGVIAISLLIIWFVFYRFFLRDFNFQKSLQTLDDLTTLEGQQRRDSWSQVKDLVKSYLNKTKGQFRLRPVLLDHRELRSVYQTSSAEARKALNELNEHSI